MRGRSFLIPFAFLMATVYLRGGSYSELPQRGNRNYSTSGYSFRLGGMLKLLQTMVPQSTNGSFVSYVRDHLELSFDHSDHEGHSILDGTSFDALTIAFR